MKFVMATLVILALSAFLCAGMLMMAVGKGVWLLVLSVVVFLALFIRFGCQAH